jgi:predicted dithiol-disulfide oxidoreductase (DUF899 family)
MRPRELPWVRIDKDYRFQTVEGPAALADLFARRSQLLVHHMMFPGCPSCASAADGYNGFVVHLEHHDVSMIAVSRYPIDELTAFKERMGWTFPYVSSLGSDFNLDFGVAYTEREVAEGPQHNLHANWDHSDEPAGDLHAFDAVGMSSFALQDGVVYHTYSAYARGMDGLWGMYQWLDRAPQGRNDEPGDRWYRLRDEYEDVS